MKKTNKYNIRITRNHDHNEYCVGRISKTLYQNLDIKNIKYYVEKEQFISIDSI